MNGSDAQKGTALYSMRAMLIANFSTAAGASAATEANLFCGQTSRNQSSAVHHLDPTSKRNQAHPIVQRSRAYTRCVGGLPAQ